VIRSSFCLESCEIAGISDQTWWGKAHGNELPLHTSRWAPGFQKKLSSAAAESCSILVSICYKNLSKSFGAAVR
jgi:hypothetical protein